MSSLSSPRRLVSVLFAAALVFGAAGCSSGDDTETSTSGDAASEAKSLNESAKEADKALGAGGCYQAAAAWATIVAKPMQLRVSGGTKEDLEAYRKEVEEFRNDIDESLRNDYDVLAKAYGDYAEAIAAIDTSNPAELMKPDVQRKLQEAGDLIDTPEVTAARDRVQAYFDTCLEKSGN